MVVVWRRLVESSHAEGGWLKQREMQAAEHTTALRTYVLRASYSAGRLPGILDQASPFLPRIRAACRYM